MFTVLLWNTNKEICTNNTFPMIQFRYYTYQLLSKYQLRALSCIYDMCFSYIFRVSNMIWWHKTWMHVCHVNKFSLYLKSTYLELIGGLHLTEPRYHHSSVSSRFDELQFKWILIKLYFPCITFIILTHIFRYHTSAKSRLTWRQDRCRQYFGLLALCSLFFVSYIICTHIFLYDISDKSHPL